MFCQKCGKDNPDGAKFCIGCGASMADAAAPLPEPEAVPESPKKTKRTLPLILGIIAGIAVLGGGTTALVLHLRQPKDTGITASEVDAANRKAEKLYEAADTAITLIREEGFAVEDGYYLFSESYEKPEDAPESGDVSVSEPDYFLWLLDEEWDDIEELEGYGFYVEEEQVLSAAVETDVCVGAFPNPVVPEDAEEMELNEDLLDHAAEGAEPETEEETEAPTEEETEAPTEASTEAPTEPASLYKWYLEPQIEADYIGVLRHSRPVDEYYEVQDSHVYSKYSAICMDGLFGVIDYEGILVAAPEYTEIYVGYDARILLTGEDYYNGWELLDDGSITAIAEPSDIMGTSTDPILGYWADENTTIISNYGSEIYTDPLDPMPMILIEAVEEITYDGGYTELQCTIDYDNPSYALIVDGEAVTDFIYEDAGNFTDGIIPMKKDGKWGYLDAEGNEVIPFEYDDVWERNRTLVINDENGHYEWNMAFDASCGYVVLCQDGEYALYDTSGACVIPFGEFEAIEPVYENKAWVKQDGLWGVITFDPDEELPAPTEPEQEGDEASADWMSLYRDVLLTHYNAGDTDSKGFDLYDMDLDGTPELIVSTGQAHVSSCEIYTVQDGELLDLGDYGVYGSIGFCEEEGFMSVDNLHMGYSYGVHYVLEDGAFRDIFSYSDNSGACEDPADIAYTINNEVVTEEEYYAAVERFPAFIGLGTGNDLTSENIDMLLS